MSKKKNTPITTPEALEEGPASEPGMIPAQSLTNITGYTDVWHRQAAKAGYFPPPVRGMYKTVQTLQGLFRRERDLRTKGRGSIQSKKERKLDDDHALAALELAQRNNELVSLDDMDSRMRPLLVSVRQSILGSTLTDDEKDQMITDFGEMLEHALTRNLTPGRSGPTAKVDADLDQAAAPDGNAVGQ